MINCEQFENNFLSWQDNKLEASQSDEMRNHYSSCQFCGDITSETIELRESLAGVSEQGLSAEFEVNLNRKINELVYGNKAQRRYNRAKLPRWAALGAGMATGLAIGVVILMPSNQGSLNQYTAVNQIDEGSTIVVDTITNESDSSKSINEEYKLDDRSKLVSGK